MTFSGGTSSFFFFFFGGGGEGEGEGRERTDQEQRDHGKNLFKPRDVPVCSFEKYRCQCNGIFQLTATELEANPFRSRVCLVNRKNTINLRRRNWTLVGMTEWNGIFPNVRATSRGIPKISKHYSGITFPSDSSTFLVEWKAPPKSPFQKNK